MMMPPLFRGTLFEMRYDETDQAERFDSARAMPKEDQARYLRPLSGLLPSPVRMVVDLGCGTGRFSVALAEEFRAPVVGVDPARTMLAKAREGVSHTLVRFTAGDATAIPLRDGAADLIFVCMAFHHFDDRQGAMREMRRVLGPGGVVAIRNTTVDALDHVAYLEYFPAAKAHLAAILPAREPLKASMSAAGLVPVLHEILPHEMAPDWNAYCDKVAARAFSDLAAISDKDFESGLAAMRREGRRTGPVVMPMDLFAFRAAPSKQP
jgi:ubiquinone/menaquinone biosynthesis C-methylase UbiE